MKKNIPILKRTLLFAGLSEEDISSALSCLDARLIAYKKGEFVLYQGEQIDSIAILVKGKLHIQKDDFWGNRSILGHINPAEMFGEAYIAPQSGALLNDVVAVEDSEVIFFDVGKILSSCPTPCRFHSIILQNMLFTISEKNRKLVQKLGHMSMRSTREKLISYLSEEATKQNSSSFTIPFNRQQLADFLSVDRSAMSNELCKMRNEHLIEFNRNYFKLL